MDSSKLRIEVCNYLELKIKSLLPPELLCHDLNMAIWDCLNEAVHAGKDIEELEMKSKLIANRYQEKLTRMKG